MQTRAIFTLLTENISAENLFKNHSNILIIAVKLVNEKVMNIEALEHWRRRKVHKMSLRQYLGDRKIELLW